MRLINDSKMKKNILTILLIFLGVQIFAWDHKNLDYYVDADQDTIYCKILKRKNKSIIVNTGGEDYKVKARHIYGYYKNGYYYAAGKAKINVMGVKQWYFLRQIRSGWINLYELNGSQINHSMINNTYSTSSVIMHYARMADEPRGKFRKLYSYWRIKLRKMSGDCPELNNYFKTSKRMYIGNRQDAIDVINEFCEPEQDSIIE